MEKNRQIHQWNRVESQEIDDREHGDDFLSTTPKHDLHKITDKLDFI